MSQRDLVEILVKWRSLADMIGREEFKKAAGEYKGVIAAILLILLEMQQD